MIQGGEVVRNMGMQTDFILPAICAMIYGIARYVKPEGGRHGTVQHINRGR